jgi:hypothetical protein
MSTLDILKRAREILSKPESWIKGAFAADKNGLAVGACGLDACSWCAEGALKEASAQLGNGRYLPISVFQSLEAQIPEEIQNHARKNAKSLIPFYNDAEERTHEEVMAWFDKAIQAEEKK